MNPRLSIYFSGSRSLVPLDPRQTMIGGISETCNLDLREYFSDQYIRTISRRHFKITYVKGEGYALMDLESLNGTQVNNLRLTPGEAVFLRPGDIIRLADNDDFIFEVVGEQDEDRTQPVPNSSPMGRMPMAEGLLHLAPDGQYVLDGFTIAHEYLTPLEHKLLDYLYTNSGRVCSYDELIRNVWGINKYDDIQDNSVAKLVSNLRKKLDTISPGAGVRHIQTVHGRGVKCLPA
jgi:hypothetical protein